MGDMTEDISTSTQLRFIGKVLSVFTHEINNHLAILKESAGLAGDILGSQQTSQQHLQDSLKVLGSIESQIGKTSWLIKNLNTFGHRMDKPLSTFSVDESIKELLVLLSRIINQKGLVVEKDFREGIPLIHSNPSKLQFIIFCFLDYALKRLDKNGIITLKTHHFKGSVTITISLNGNLIAASDETICAPEIYQHIANQLDGSLSLNEKELTIAIPVMAHLTSGPLT